MPTSLPTALRNPAAFIDRTELFPATGGIWLVTVWAIALLLFGAIAHFGPNAGAIDALQSLAAF